MERKVPVEVSASLIRYPFGMGMPGRTWSVTSDEEYRFGYNGMETNYLSSPKQDMYSTDFREFNSLTGRWNSIDPAYKSYESPYTAMHCNPISYMDPKGDDPPLPVEPAKEVGSPSKLNILLQKIGIGVANIFRSEKRAYIPKSDFSVTFTKVNTILDNQKNIPFRSELNDEGGITYSVTDYSRNYVYDKSIKSIGFSFDMFHIENISVYRKNIFGNYKEIFTSGGSGVVQTPLFKVNRFLIPKRNENFKFVVTYKMPAHSPTKIESTDATTLLDIYVLAPRSAEYNENAIIRTQRKTITSWQKKGIIG